MHPTLGPHVEDARPGLTRRQLLVRGVLAGAAVVVAGVVVRLAQLFGESPALGRRVLTAREERALIALITAALPGGDGMPPGDPVFIVDSVDRYLAGSDPDVRLLFKSTLHVVEERSLFGHLARFSSLELAARQDELRAWERTGPYLGRAAFQSLKMAIGMAYFEQPGASEAVGWYVGCSPPHLVHKSKARLIGGRS